MPKVVLGQPITFTKQVLSSQQETTTQMNMDLLTFNSSADTISFLLTSSAGSKEVVLDGADYQAVAMATLAEVQSIRQKVIAQAVASGKLPAGTIDNWSI